MNRNLGMLRISMAPMACMCILSVLPGCGQQNATVQLDIGAIKRAGLSLGAANQIKLRVISGESEWLIRSFDVGDASQADMVQTLEVPAGPLTIEVLGLDTTRAPGLGVIDGPGPLDGCNRLTTTATVSAPTASYYGEVAVVLRGGGEQSAQVDLFPAGHIEAQAFPVAGLELPNPGRVLFRAQNPQPNQPAELSSPLVDGYVARVLPTGTYTTEVQSYDADTDRWKRFFGDATQYIVTSQEVTLVCADLR